MRSRCFKGIVGALLLTMVCVLGACSSVGGTRLVPPTASIQQLTVRSNGEWTAVVRFQNFSYDSGMHVYAIDATLHLAGKLAGHVAISPALDIPAMDADIAAATFRPDAAGSAALAATKGNAIRYQLKGVLSVGKGTTGPAETFKLHSEGYLSPVPGVANVWR